MIEVHDDGFPSLFPSSTIEQRKVVTGNVHPMWLRFGLVRELLGGYDQPYNLFFLYEYVLGLILLVDMSKECFDSLVGLVRIDEG